VEWKATIPTITSSEVCHKNKIQFGTLRLLLNPKLHAGKDNTRRKFIFKCPNSGKEMVLFDKTLRKRAPLSALLSLQKGVY